MRMVCFVVGLILANGALGATMNGDLAVGSGSAGLNSTGSFDITVTKSNAVQLSNLNALVITDSVNNAVDKTSSNDVCYYATTTQYAIDLDSINDFVLINDTNSNQTIPYKLYWDDGKNNTIDATFASNNDTIKSFPSNNQTSVNCQTSNGTNATVTVSIRHQDFNSATAGLYTDTVNFMLKAQ